MVHWPTKPSMLLMTSNGQESEGFMLMRRLMRFASLHGHVYQSRLNIGIR
jgi:hypothetical protein